MKSLFAFGLPVAFLAAFVWPASGQIGSQNALGGRSASAGMSRPLGGIGPGAAGRRSGPGVRATGPVYAAPYAYSFYVPNYFDSYYGADSYSPYSVYPESSAFLPPPPPQAIGPPPQMAVPPAPPVIINQYFGAPPSGPPPYQAPPPEAGPSGAAQTPGDPLGPTDNYYLIAYKDHTVYTALAFWVEDKTLHYVTTGNKHNQASLDLIDMDLTKTLNQSRGVPFTITGR